MVFKLDEQLKKRVSLFPVKRKAHVMDPKYSNIFWHQGIKIFEESLLKSTSGRVRMEHLENDVTKALLNLFQHCSGSVLGAFLSLLEVKGRPETFDFDFQVTGESSFSIEKHGKK